MKEAKRVSILVAVISLIFTFLFFLLVDQKEFISGLQALSVGSAQAMMRHRTELAEDVVFKALKRAEDDKRPDVTRLVSSVQELSDCYETMGRFEDAALLNARLASIIATEYGADSHQYLEVQDTLKRISPRSRLLRSCPHFSGKMRNEVREDSKI